MKPKPKNPKAGGRRRIKTAVELREFTSNKELYPMMTELYRTAQAEVLKRRQEHGSKPAASPERVLHELQVHQVELEIQNAELQEGRDRVETLLEKYTDLYDFAPVGYFSLDKHGRILEVNLMGASMLGVERSRLISRSLPRFVAPASQPVLLDFLQRLFAGAGKQRCEAELFAEGSSPAFWGSFHGVAAISASDPRKWCRVAVSDITAVKLAEDKVRVSEMRYRRLFEAAHDGVLLLDPGTRKITDANPFMTKLLGYPRDQLVGKELFEIGLLEDKSASQGMFLKLKKNSEIRYENLPLESQSGRHQEVEVVANLYQENGHCVIQCTIRDITERKRAEELLLRNEALFSALVSQAPVGVYVVDARMRLQQVNPRALHVFRNVHPLVGRNFSEVIHLLWPKLVAEQVLQRFRHTLEIGEPYQAPEFTARRLDSRAEESYEWQIQRVTLPAGERGVVCFFTDITERKRSEEARRRLEVLTASNQKLEQEIVRRRAVEESLQQSEQQQRRLLEQSLQMQEQLRLLSRRVLAVQEEERREISRELHDVIAQTLTGINLRLAALKKEAALNARGIDRKIDRAQRLVEKSVEIVHRFARDLRPAVLDDLGLIPALHAFMKSFTARTGIRASLKAAAKVEQLDLARRTVLFRVAQEAFTNVARHAQASRVEVRLQKLPESFCMRITDDGKSFDVDRTLNGKGRKRLGLLGMRERLEMMDGCFEIESAPGKGTTIVARIPLGKVAARGGGVH